MKNSRGFTLLEAMVVVGIMGVLAAMTIVGLNSLTKRAEASTVLGELAQEINNAKMLAAQYGDPILIFFYDDTNKAQKDKTGFSTWRERKGGVDIENLAWIIGPPPNLPLVGGPPYEITRVNFRHVTRSVLAPKMPGNITTFPGTGNFPYQPLFERISTSDPVCTFCIQPASGVNMGAIRVFPDGHIALSKKKEDEGGGVIVVQPDPKLPAVTVFAILAPSGMTRIF